MDVYLFIQTQAGMASTVMNALASSGAVTRAATVTGNFDVFARIDDVDFADLSGRLLDQVQRTPGVVRTTTSVGLTPKDAGIRALVIPTMPLRVSTTTPQALVFANFSPGGAEGAVREILDSKDVLSFAFLSGEYDAVMQVAGRTAADIARKVFRSVQSVAGVASTATSFVVEVTPLPAKRRAASKARRRRR